MNWSTPAVQSNTLVTDTDNATVDLIAEHDRPYSEYGHLSMIHVLVKINVLYYYS